MEQVAKLNLYLSIDQIWCVNELWFKRYIQKCTLAHVLILMMSQMNHGMVKNAKFWISQEGNITFLWNKKFLTCASDSTFWEVVVFTAELNFKKLSNVLLRKSMNSIYKSFTRSWLDCCDLIYDQPNDESFCQQIENIQYNTSLVLNVIIKGTFRFKLNSEIDLESCKFRQWFRKHCTFCKIKNSGLPSFLFDPTPKSSHASDT